MDEAIFPKMLAVLKREAVLLTRRARLLLASTLGLQYCWEKAFFTYRLNRRHLRFLVILGGGSDLM